MIHVKYDKETDKFLVKGKINLGIIGEYENKENEETIAPEYRGQNWEEVVMPLYESKQEEIYAILSEYTNGSPNNGTIQKVDIEKKMREYFYMFNFDGLKENINCKYLGLYFSFIEFEFEDNWGQELFGSTVGTLKEDFSLKDWINF